MVTLRGLAGVLFVAAFAVAFEDLRQSVSGLAGPTITTLRTLCLATDPASLDLVQAFLTERTYPWIWHRLVEPLLSLPVALLSGAFGYLLWTVDGRRSRRREPPVKNSDEVIYQEAAGTGSSERSEYASALASCRRALAGIALFSAVSNVLVLTGAIFMLEIFDRVLPSRSLPTLVGLAILACGLFVAQGGLDFIRLRLLGRIGATLDSGLSNPVYESIVKIPVRVGSRVDSLQALRDLDSVRAFLSSMGPTALFDLPWIPFYLAIIFAFHALLGLTALAGAVVLVGLTLLTEMLTRGPTRVATECAVSRHRIAEASKRNAEVVMAMGFAHRIGAQWREANQRYVAAQQHAGDVGGGFGTVSRVTRLMLQSGVLGVGAYLVIRQDASAGIIIAASILTARALAPVDLAIAHWRGFVAARQSWQRLNKLLKAWPADQVLTPLPPPTSSLSVEGVSIAPPGEQRIVVGDISFTLPHGHGLGIIGPSGSGKSSLARVLVGAWSAARGKVRLDGAALDQWTPGLLGRHIGYLPQDVELFAGTVTQNIARFEPNADSEVIIRAARAADVHELIVHLPKGYDTEIGEYGVALSAGQRQRVGLARALYGDPFLVVLDEPDANLDAEGIVALSRAILSVRTRGGVVVVVAHRHNVLANVDFLLALEKGRMLAAGPKDAVMKKLRIGAPGLEQLKVVSDAG